MALPNSFAPLVERLALFIALGAIFFAFSSTIAEDLKDIVVEANFKKAIKKFKIDEKEEEKRLLLKALIKMKAMNHNSKLGNSQKNA